MNDLIIRKILRETLSQSYAKDKDTLIVEELGLRHGTSRIDLAVINGTIQGYEIKSDIDTLRRLPSQIQTYNLIFDYITLVVGYRHAYAAMQLIPEWWGIEIAENVNSEKTVIYAFREANKNPAPDIYSVVKLLWREEAINILDKISTADGVRSKPRKFVYEKLIGAAEENVIAGLVREQLKSRRSWRVTEQQVSDDD